MTNETSEVNLDVILHVLAPCETWGKILVVLYEDAGRRQDTGMTGYTIDKIKALLYEKRGVLFKDADLEEKCVLMLVKEKLLAQVSTADAKPAYFDLTAVGAVWAKRILSAAKDNDPRFMCYVRRSENSQPRPRTSKQVLHSGTW